MRNERRAQCQRRTELGNDLITERGIGWGCRWPRVGGRSPSSAIFVQPWPAGPVKRNRYVRLTGATKTVNRALETKNRALAGIKGYITNLPTPKPDQVISAYNRLLQVESPSE